MRVLLLTGSSATYMAPPRLAENQIVAGPDWPDERDAAGRWCSLRTPLGEYAVSEILARLSPEEQPDVLVCLVDASRRNLPRQVRAFRGPKVLLLADTHHLQSPLMSMIRYVAAEMFDRIVLLYDRHHAPLFGAAGCTNLFWFPGLTLPFEESDVRNMRGRAHPLAQVGFVGQMGKLHPRRARLLDALTAAKMPLAARALPQREALAHYGSSALGFNASLNGDLNLRVFEILASGALLLTDHLGAGSGLEEIAQQGAGFVTYRTPEELVERARHYLARPDEARALAHAGQVWFDVTLNAERRRAMFRALAFDGVAPAPFPLPVAATKRFRFDSTRDLLASTIVYEGVQELHRTQETVDVALTAGGPAGFAELCATLPRVRLIADGADAKPDLLVMSSSDAAAGAYRRATRVWCWDALDAQLPELAATFSRTGFAAASSELAVYCRPDGAAPVVSAAELLQQARASLSRGDQVRALELGRAALQADPRHVPALVLLAELALLKSGGALAEKLMRQATALAPKDPFVATLLAEALLQQGRVSEADAALAPALRLDPGGLRVLRTLADLRHAQKRDDECVRILEQAARLHPRSADLASRLGTALRRHGRLLEGLQWQRRALGVTEPLVPLGADERVRVVFLAQHPQGWTCLESVWQALRADPRFETTLVGVPYDHPYEAEGGPEAIFAFFRQRGIPHLRWEELELRPGFADIVFVQNPYDVTRPAPLRTAELVKLVPRLAYLPYGLEIGGGERNNTMVMNLPLQQHAWLLCARSERQRDAYARHCATGNAHVAVTGHAKLDALRDLPAVDASELERFAAGRKLIGWNAHFDLRPKAGSACGEGFSTFLRWHEFVLREFAARRDRLALVLRPHPLLFGTLISRRLWPQAKIDQFLARAEAAGVRLDRAPSYLPLFARADAMLSDASSFVLEFSATGKPLAYLHNPDGPQLNDDGDFVRDHCYWTEREEELRSFLDQVEAGEDPRGAARRAAFPRYIHLPPEGTGEAVRRAILDRLAQENLQIGRILATA